VTAPAGRGKTALLIRWVQQLGEEWPICFVPISIRYETNRAAVFYQALAARLASLLGETLPQTLTDPDSFYKEKATEYLEQFTGERRCLLVVDGLDEAAGWRLDAAILPIEPPPGIRVLVSGRELAGDTGSDDWLRRLGWWGSGGAAKTLQVPRLTRFGVADVLVKMGFPLGDLAKNVDIITELFRLTEGGDPLLLELYVKDLWKKGDEAARLRPEDLAKLKPGFAAYFRDWFEQQRTAWSAANLNLNEEVVNAAMLVLSCAAGPMKLAVLSPIVQSLLDDRTLITKQTMQPISRFVIGDGIDVGFAFAHPKLAAFIREDYFGGSNSVQDGKKAICDWGRSIVTKLNAGEMQPNAAPDYALLYYLQHLEELQPGPGLLPYRELMEDGWRMAWLAHEEGLRGFARDLQVAWTKLRRAAQLDPAVLRQPKVGIGGLIRCALCLCSIRSVGSAVPPNFMVELVRQGLVTVRQALYFSRFKSEPDQTQLLQGLAPYLTGADFDEAVAEARALTVPENQVYTLAKLAARTDGARRSELLAEAIEATERIELEFSRKSAIERINQIQNPPSEAPAEAPQPEYSGSTETSLFDDFQLPPPDDVRAAFEEIALEEDHFAYSYKWKQLVPYLPEDLLERSLDIGLSEESWTLEWLLTQLAPFLNERLLRHAFDLILGFKEEYYREIAFRVLLPYLWKHDQNRVMDFVLQERDNYRSGEYLRILLPDMGDEHMSEAMDRVANWQDRYRRDEAFRLLIDKLPDALIEKAFSMAIAILESDSAESLGYLLPHLHGDLFVKGLEILLSLPDYTRGRMLDLVGPRLSVAALHEVIEAVSGNMEDINRLLPYLSDEDRASTVASTYKTSFKVGDGIALAASFMTLAERLPDNEAQRACRAAHMTTDQITESQDRAFACLLLSFSRLLPSETRNALFREAKTICSQMRDRDTALAISFLSTLSPESSQTDFEELLSHVHSAGFDISKEDATLQFIALALNPRLSEADFRKELAHMKSLMEDKRAKNPWDDDEKSLFQLMASALPRLSRAESESFRKTGMELISENDKSVGLFVASISPSLTPDEASYYVSQSLTYAKTDSDSAIPAMLAPYLDTDRLLPTILEILDRAISTTRGDLLLQISIFEGQWLELIGVRPVLGRGAGPKSTLERLGSPLAIVETFEAIEDVMRWWP